MRPNDSAPVSRILCEHSPLSECLNNLILGDTLWQETCVIRWMRFHLVDNILEEHLNGFIAKTGMIFRYFIKAFLEDKISGVANFVVSNGNDSPSPVPVGWRLFISDNFINNFISLIRVLNTESTDIEIGEFIVSGNGGVPVICSGSPKGIRSDIVCRNVSGKFRRFSINICVNTSKIEGTIAEKDDITQSGRCPRLICMC